MRQLKITKSITDRKSESLERYLSDVSREEMINSDEEVELARRIKQGDPLAFEKLIRSNLRFVISVAKQYQNQGLTLADLICEGNIGLMKAAQKFDETRGFKFISYAVWWIRRSIIEAIMEHSRLVRLPQSKLDLLNKVNRAMSYLEQQYSREASHQEVADYLEVPVENVKRILGDARISVSLDTPVGEESDASLSDLLSSENMPETDALLLKESLKKDIEITMRNLSEREKEIVMRYFGISGNYFCLEEIADEMGISTERVRQIKERALIRLRHSRNSKLLRKYLA